MALIRENVSLASLTYYKIGGLARYFAQPESIDDLKKIAQFIREKSLRYFVLGAGSNVLFSDDGFDGLIIHTAKLDRHINSNEAEIDAGSSAMVIQVLRLCMTHGIGGFEFLVGVPGNVGGILYMNAGTKTGEVSSSVFEVTAFDLANGTSRTITKDQMRYSYRNQQFLGLNEIILGGKFRGTISDPKVVQDTVQALLLARKKSQPIDKPSCGSVFKNPDPTRGLHAWKVIADLGLRGHRIGNAQISELHTNFIVNLGNAKSTDVRALINEAKLRARDKLGIELEEEVRIIDPAGGSSISAVPPGLQG